VVRQDHDAYLRTWRETHGAGVAPPAPLCGGMTFVDRDPARARAFAERYIAAYYHSVMKHYAFQAHAHEGVRGYEYYASISKHIDKRGADAAALEYVNLMPWGTPEQTLEKVANLRELIGPAAFNPCFSYGAMPLADAEASLRLFAREVLPVLKSWESEPLAKAAPLSTQR